MNVLTMKQATKTITLIAAAGKKLDQRIHDVAVSGVAHFLMHGDTTLLSQLVHAMPRSSRGNALKFWITKHVSVKWDSKAHGGKGGWKKNGDTELDSWQKLGVVFECNDVPFFHKEDTEKSEFNPEASILSLVARINKYKQDHAVNISETAKQAIIRAVS